MQITKNLELARDWLTESGILYIDGKEQRYGPVKGGYLIDKKRYDCIYHEINGYGMSCFVNLYRSTKEEKYLEHAKGIAEYLLSTLYRGPRNLPSSVFAHSISLPDMRPQRQYFAFDNGMIASGLMDLYVATGDLEYYEASKKCLKWLIDCLQMDDGAFNSYYDAKTGGIHHGGPRFDKDRSVLHAKIAIAMLKVWEHSGSQNFLDSATALLKWASGLQDEDGAFWSNEYRKVVFTHAHCYSVEGFLYAYHKMGNDKYRDAALRGIDWLCGAQLPDGSLNYQYKNRHSVLDGMKDRFIKRKTSDATAQAARLWLLANTLDEKREYSECAHRAIEFLEKMQITCSGDRNVIGGLIYRQKETLGRKKIQPVIYSWCTQFAAQAFSMWLKYEAGTLSQDAIARIF